MRHQVTTSDTATALGSGDVPVLATPRLIAWMEAATVRSAQPLIAKGQTTVGTAVRMEHRRPTRVGASVEVSAEPATVGNYRLTFAVRVTDGAGNVVATGQIDRVIVDRERFLGDATDGGAD